MVARRPRGPGPGGRQKPANPVTLLITQSSQQEPDERSADERDPPDVAGDVGVLLGGRRGEARSGARRGDGLGPRGARLARRGLGRLLLGDDRRLELGCARLLVIGQRGGRPGRDLGRLGGRLGRRSGRGALERRALAGSGRAAADSLGHGLGKASIDGSGRHPREGRARRSGRRRQRIPLRAGVACPRPPAVRLGVRARC